MSEQASMHKREKDINNVNIFTDLTDDVGVMPGAIQPNAVLEALRRYPGWYTYATTLKYVL